jgi:hypothetical protein
MADATAVPVIKEMWREQNGNVIALGFPHNYPSQ